jgi:hypothetical protein
VQEEVLTDEFGELMFIHYDDYLSPGRATQASTQCGSNFLATAQNFTE